MKTTATLTKEDLGTITIDVKVPKTWSIRFWLGKVLLSVLSYVLPSNVEVTFSWLDSPSASDNFLPEAFRPAGVPERFKEEPGYEYTGDPVGGYVREVSPDEGGAVVPARELNSRDVQWAILHQLVNQNAIRNAALHDLIWDARELVRLELTKTGGISKANRDKLMKKIQDIIYTVRGDPFDYEVRRAMQFPNFEVPEKEESENAV